MKDVSVVTIQYRLGYLVMWTTGDSACRENLNLWDQTFAFKWIMHKISQFDGDYNNITLLGYSSGGTSVDLLSLSPHSRGNLFPTEIDFRLTIFFISLLP